jgi:hypothetical protein
MGVIVLIIRLNNLNNNDTLLVWYVQQTTQSHHLKAIRSNK